MRALAPNPDEYNYIIITSYVIALSAVSILSMAKSRKLYDTTIRVLSTGRGGGGEWSRGEAPPEVI